MFNSLISILRSLAHNRPQELAYIFLADGETDERRITYAELDQQARIIAAHLQGRYEPGSRALLLYPPGLDYVAAFFGCLYAGITAVPAYPPRPRRPMPRIQAIVADSQPAVALTDSRILSNIEQRLAELPDMAALDWIDTTSLDLEIAEQWQDLPVQPDDLAYLQYTSGSTATPKGVMVSHGNLDYTLADLDAGWEGEEPRTMVTWLPPFHDMGLVFGILLPLYAGYPSVMMAPVSFVQRPLRWLQALSRYRGTHSAAPNFAFDLCLEKITPKERAALDLSAWRIALNGAEPVRQDTLQRFAAAYAGSGFRWQTFAPGYGLAEATLQVTGIMAASVVTTLAVDAAALEGHTAAPVPPEQPGARVLVGYQPSPLATRWQIADPDTLTACPPGQVGEIWIAGPGVAKGYWQRPQATGETFHTYLADTSDGPFLRTGDLGFVHDGHLFVTGRLKDLIIVRGRNHYPQDIELTAEQSHHALEPGSGAAFSLEINGEERVALVCELRREQRKTDPHEIIDAIREAVAAEHELQLHAVTLTMPGQSPKTSSGKIQRQAARATFLAGEFVTLGRWIESAEKRQPDAIAPQDVATVAAARDSREVAAIRDWLVARIAAQVRVSPERIDVREPLDRVGLDSLAAVAITGELGDWLGRDLSPTMFYEFPTVEAITLHLAGTPATRPGHNGFAAHTAVSLVNQSFSVNGISRTSVAPALTPVRRASRTSLVPLRAQGTKTPFFLVPPAASTVLSFGSLVQCMDQDQPLYGLQPLGMDGRHPPQFRVEEMAAHYISEILTIQPTGPYLLGGRCFGGLVAFEMAQQLRARGQHVALLAILDTLQPPKPLWLRDQSGSDQEGLASPLRHMTRSSARRLYLLWRRLTITDAFTMYALKQMRPEQRFPNVLGAEGRHIRNTARAHYEANELYLPRLYDGRLTLFSNAGHTGSHQLNWAALTQQAVDIHIVPGNHITMFKEPYVRALAQVLTESLERAVLRSESPIARRPVPRPSLGAAHNIPVVRSTVVHVADTDHTGSLPGDGLEDEVAKACETILGAQLAATDHVQSLDQRPFVEAYLLDEIKRRTGKRLPLAALVLAPTVAQLASLVRSDGNQAASSPLVPLQPNGSRSPFFLAPDIDRTVLSLVELARLLGPQQPCFGFQPPGLEVGQSPHESINEMAAFYLRAMRQVQPAGPYLLGGIGFGGVVAFEMAQLVCAAGDDVALLAVLDTKVPPNATLQYWYPPAALRAKGPSPNWFVQRAYGRLVYVLHRRHLRDAIPRRARAEMAWQRKVGHQFSPVTRRIQTMLAAHLQARLQYQPHVYPGRITLFSNSKRAGAHQVKWALLTEVGMEIEVIPGDHRSIFRQPGITQLAERLSLHLEQAQRSWQTSLYRPDPVEASSPIGDGPLLRTG